MFGVFSLLFLELEASCVYELGADSVSIRVSHPTSIGRGASSAVVALLLLLLFILCLFRVICMLLLHFVIMKWMAFLSTI